MIWQVYHAKFMNGSQCFHRKKFDRNPSRSSKISKDSTLWAQGQMKWAKLAKTSSIYDVTHKNPHPQPQKCFLIFYLFCFLIKKFFLIKYIWFKITYIVLVSWSEVIKIFD